MTAQNTLANSGNQSAKELAANAAEIPAGDAAGSEGIENGDVEAEKVVVSNMIEGMKKVA